jgi:hypothetical protein
VIERKITVQASPLKALLERHYTGTSYSDTNYWDDAQQPIKLETVNRVGTLQSGFEHAFDGTEPHVRAPAARVEYRGQLLL